MSGVFWQIQGWSWALDRVKHFVCDRRNTNKKNDTYKTYSVVLKNTEDMDGQIWNFDCTKDKSVRYCPRSDALREVCCNRNKASKCRREVCCNRNKASKWIVFSISLFCCKRGIFQFHWLLGMPLSKAHFHSKKVGRLVTPMKTCLQPMSCISAMLWTRKESGDSVWKSRASCLGSLYANSIQRLSLPWPDEGEFKTSSLRFCSNWRQINMIKLIFHFHGNYFQGGKSQLGSLTDISMRKSNWLATICLHYVRHVGRASQGLNTPFISYPLSSCPLWCLV